VLVVVLVAAAVVTQMLRDGVHSGHASGIVPSSFRIMRQLLSRVEDEETGRVVPPEFHVDVPPARVQQMAAAAEILGEPFVRQFPFVEGGAATPRLHTAQIASGWLCC